MEVEPYRSLSVKGTNHKHRAWWVFTNTYAHLATPRLRVWSSRKKYPGPQHSMCKSFVLLHPRIAFLLSLASSLSQGETAILNELWFLKLFSFHNTRLHETTESFHSHHWALSNHPRDNISRTSPSAAQLLLRLKEEKGSPCEGIKHQWWAWRSRCRIC